MNPYDEVPYRGSAVPQTHPDRLATLATLFGMKPAAVESCRVLEIGCGNGRNLIPMAYALPGSRCVGIDVAAQPIAEAQATVEKLQLKNIVLQQLDIMGAGPELGEFDYIISHGVYSWVPTPVQDRLLELCRRHLAPSGVAYVSYDAYPGAHLGKLTREIMLYAVRNVEEPAEKIRQARALVKSLSEARPDQDFYAVFLRDEVARLAEWSDWSVFHDNLAPNYCAVYFHEFVEHAARHGLEFLAEADYYQMQPQTSDPKALEWLKRMAGDEIARQQYLDFLSGRHFRRTLLCHAGTRLERKLEPEQVAQFYVASSVRPEHNEPDIRTDAIEEFRGSKGASIAIGRPLAKAALTLLSRAWPQALAFEALASQARELATGNASRENQARAQDAALLGELILRTYAANLVELHVYAPRLVLEPGERPTASAVARLELERGTKVTNLVHSTIDVSDRMCAELLRALDGTRDRSALREELRSRAKSPQEQEAIERGLDENLKIIGRLALLVA